MGNGGSKNTSLSYYWALDEFEISGALAPLVHLIYFYFFTCTMPF